LNLTRLLAGEISEDQLPLHPPAWYEDKRIDFLRGQRVMEVRPGDRKVTLNGGETVDFDKLVLASGATAFRPPVPGAEVPGTGVLRSLDDARRLIAVARKGAHMVVIGGGLLGLEAAADWPVGARR
jgi:nitrite reductase (NADH) large subunit